MESVNNILAEELPKKPVMDIALHILERSPKMTVGLMDSLVILSVPQMTV